MVSHKPLPSMTDAEFKQWVFTWWPEMTNISPLGFGLPYLFGDGSDGDVVIAAGTTTITNTPIKQYMNLTVALGATLKADSYGCSIFVRERCSIEGTLHANAANLYSNGAAGLAGVGAGGAGGGEVRSYGGNGGGGGESEASGFDGGNGGINVINQAAAGGGTGLVTEGADGYDMDTQYTLLAAFTISQTERDKALFSYGSGGGGGGGGTVGDGGIGGNGGGYIILFANELTVSGTISANGENGADGATDGGGGGAGGGGVIYIVTRKLTQTGTITSTGGTGGTGAGVGYDGGDGGNGAVVKVTIPY
jgi:hypothetical protein